MSAPEGRPDQAIMERLVSALERALGGEPARAPLEAARDAARVVGLEGLGRVLGRLVPYGGRRWPAEALPVCERVRGLARAARAAASLDPLRRVEAEMEELAERLGYVTSGSGAIESAGSLTLAEAVGPMRAAGEDLLVRARDVRITTSVAAALRAALDWLAGERAPLRFAVDDSALEIVLDRVNFGGLEAADRVLRDVGGNVGPALEGATPAAPLRPWIMRLPTLTPRPSYLMVVQGGLSLAIPWQAVLRLRMAAADALAGRERVFGLPVIAPLAAPTVDAPQRPAIVVASGWKRACMVADRLVWRMIAEPCDAVGAPTRGIAGAVRTEDGDVYWVLDPAALLEPVEPPAAPPGAARPADGDGRDSEPAPPFEPALPAEGGPPESGEPAPLPELGPGDVELHEEPAPLPEIEPGDLELNEEPAPPPEIEPGDFEPHEEPAPLPELGPGDIEPLEAPEIDEPPPGPWVPPAAAPGPAGVPAPPPPEPVPPPRSEPRSAPARGRDAGSPRGRALIAEDSIAARIFLARMLEQEGFEVQAVARAADLFNALAGPWRLVCVDVELPDGRGADLLRRARAGAGEATPVVALVRDADDRAVARAAGVALALRKPFEREELVRLLAGLGIVREKG